MGKTFAAFAVAASVAALALSVPAAAQADTAVDDTAPTDLIVADATVDSMTIQWDAPDADVTATSYFVDIDTTEAGVLTPWHQETVDAGQTSLTVDADPGVAYTISVSAAGAGWASEPTVIDDFTPGSDPSSPTGLQGLFLTELWQPAGCEGVQGFSDVCLQWDAPSNSGFTWTQSWEEGVGATYKLGDAQTIESYVLEYRAEGGPWQTKTASTTTLAFWNSDEDGWGREFRVAAVTATGTGPFSAAISAGAPSPARELTLTAGDDGYVLSWEAPALPGGSTDDVYYRVLDGEFFDHEEEYTNTPGSGDFPWYNNTQVDDATSLNLGALTAGSEIDVVVLAGNRTGWGGPARLTTTVPAGAPGAPTDVSATAGEGSVTVAWTPPVDDGGAPIIDYEVQLSVGGEVVASERTAGSSVTFTDLTNGQAYAVTLTVTNGYAVTSWSGQLWVTPATVPGEVGELAVSAGAGSAVLTWAAPSDDGGAALTGYLVQYASPQLEGGDWITWPTSGTGATATVTGLTPGQDYRFRVAGVNDVGTGAFGSDVQAATTTPVVSSQTSTLTVGATHTLTVSGLTPNTSHELVLHSTPISLGAAVTDASGVLTITFVVPAVDAGDHELWIHEGTSAADPVLVHAVRVAASGRSTPALAATGLDAGRLPWLVGAALVLLGAGVGIRLRVRARALAPSIHS